METVFRPRATWSPRFIRQLLAALILAVTSAGFATSAWANHLSARTIFVNGQLLNPYEVAQADQAAGYRLPSGFYWLDHGTGYWGLVGGPALGRVAPTGGGGGGGGGQGHYNTVIDPGGGCEGGSCVNIIDRW